MKERLKARGAQPSAPMVSNPVDSLNTTLPPSFPESVPFFQESSSENEEEEENLVYIPKTERDILEKEIQLEKEKERALSLARQKQSLETTLESVFREEQLRRDLEESSLVLNDSKQDGLGSNRPSDEDGIDEEQEFQDWKAREFSRLERDILHVQ
jgi:hypothetical protein